MAFDPEKIQERIDHARTAEIEIGSDDGGLGISIKRLVDAMEVAKVMAISKQAVPGFMRNEPGICYAAVVRAVRWGVDPFFVAENMFVAKLKGGEEKIGFQAQLINSIINLATPRILTSKLRCRYEGAGDDLKCIVYGTPKGDKEPLEYETPALKTITDHLGRNEYGKVKGSPLYDLDPRQQLWYYGSKNFIRRWFPEVLGGVYDPEDYEIARMKDVTPPSPVGPQTSALVARLQDRKLKHAKKTSRGFDADHVNREVDKANGVTKEKSHEQKTTAAAEGNDPEIRDSGGHDADDRGGDKPDHAGAGGIPDQPSGIAEAAPARGKGAKQAKAEIFPPDREAD